MTTPSMDDVMQVIRSHMPSGFAPKIGMILGSGLSSVADQMTGVSTIPYQAIPGLTTGSVQGHASLLAMGSLSGIPLVCLRGRLHLYEGHSYQSIRTLIHMVRKLGCQYLLITCAAGSLRQEAGAGEIMMITDHINFQPGNPLVGPNDESIGPRFVGLEDTYDLGLQDVMQKAADMHGIHLHRGVYLSTLGPSFETPAEIRAFRVMGADAVGMSVVPEAIIARHCGMRVAGLAAITNLAAGMSKEHITHEATLQFGAIAARAISKMIPNIVQDIDRGMV